MPMKDPIFIVGAPRSGTTLLQCMLSANKDTFSLPETHFFCSILPALNLKPEDPINSESILLITTSLREVVKIDIPDPLDSKWISRATGNRLIAMGIFQDVIELFRPDHDRHGSLRLIEKTPNHIFNMHDILKYMPSVRFINMVRDPRDVASSLYQLPTATTKSMVKYANNWKDYIQQAVEFERKYPEKILSIRYEDLIVNTEKALVEICEFLDLDFHISMISDFSSEQTACILPHEKWKEEVKTGEIKNKSGIWRKRISRGQAWIVEQESAPFLTGCRYVSDAHPSHEEKKEALERESDAVRYDNDSETMMGTWLQRLAKMSEQLNHYENYPGAV